MAQFNPIQSRKAFSQASGRLQALVNDTLVGLNKEGSELSRTQANEILAKVLGAKSYNQVAAALANEANSITNLQDAFVKSHAVELASEVTCLNQWADRPPVFMTIKLDPKTVKKILQAQETLKESQSVSMKIDVGGAVFYDATDAYYETPDFSEQIQNDQANIGRAIDSYKASFEPNDVCAMEPASIEVTQHDLTISAVMRGAPRDFECTTPAIPLNVLGQATQILALHNTLTGAEIFSVNA